MKFTQAIKMALSSVVANKMRSFLTMLGIIIGILSVIRLIGMGQGTKKQVADQIQGLGTNLITVSITGSREITVSNEEIATLKTKPGRFINQNDLDNRYKVAVVGVDVIDAVFPSRNVVGKTILVNGNEFTIIGVLQSKGSTSSGSNDNKIIIPITTAQRLLKNKTIKTFYVETTSSDTVNDAMANLQVFMLRKSNNDSTKFRVFNQSNLLSTATASSDSMTLMP